MTDIFAPYEYLTSTKLNAAFADEAVERSAADASLATADETETAARIAGDAGSTVRASTIAALRAITDTRSVLVEGYYAPVDGGEGTFIYAPSDTTSADNGGTIIVDAMARRWYRQTGGQRVNARWFGAMGGGSADDTASLQAMINAGPDRYAPPGTYLITSPLSVPYGTFEGGGKTAAVLLLGTNGMVGVALSSAAPVALVGLQISPQAGITGTIGVSISPSSGANSESTLRDLQLIGLDRCIVTTAAAGFTIENVACLNFVLSGISVQNTTQPDAGDSAISDCYIQAANQTAVGIDQLSSGGLKISNTKILAGLYGYALTLDAGANTGDLLIGNCSFEGQAGASISLGQSAAGGNFHSVEITGCQFNLTLQAVSVLNSFATPGWITDLSITGGSMWINASGTGINLAGVTGFSISGVDFHSLGSAVTCINVSSTCANGLIAPMNRFGAGIVNYVLNAGNLVVVQPKIQCGSGSTNTSLASGPLFAGSSGSITYPLSYLGNPPKVLVTPNATGSVGAVSAYAVSVGLSTFAVYVIGETNSAPVAYDWISFGDW